MQEVTDPIVESVEIAGEVQTNSADEIVALFCSYKDKRDPSQYGNDDLEISKGDQPYFRLKGGQFKKMPRGIAQWHLGKSSRWDATQPLELTIKSLEEIQIMKNAAQAKKHAQADADAQAAQAAKAEVERLELEAAAKAKVRRELLDQALGAGVIKTSDEADDFTNEQIAEMLKK